MTLHKPLPRRRCLGEKRSSSQPLRRGQPAWLPSKERERWTATGQNLHFSATLVDLTNPEARCLDQGRHQGGAGWHGASGWMADFGEGLPYDAVLFSGADPGTFHDRYAEEWARVNREAIQESGRGDDIVFFNRSGYTKSPRYSTLFWVGDQLVDWDEHDGIKCAVTGLLVERALGLRLDHTDIGGYTALTTPCSVPRVQGATFALDRTRRLHDRFPHPRGQHPRGQPPVLFRPETLRHFVRFAKIYAAWSRTGRIWYTKPRRRDSRRQASLYPLPG